MSVSSVPLPVVSDPVSRLRHLLHKRPLYITVETTNICNARCGFCAYPKMKRAKGVMASDLFAKAVRDYAELGGGAVSLTPIVGDVLLDPLLTERLDVLRRTPSITDISVVTNGIAWKRWSVDDRMRIAESMDTINFSLGGLDRESYDAMYHVDRFETVRESIGELCNIKSRHHLKLRINLNFRVNRPIDELLSDPRMETFRRPEINAIEAINSFANWGGKVTAVDLPPGATLVPLGGDPDVMRLLRRNPCFVHYTSPQVTVNGWVSACGCMNAEVDTLILGDLNEQTLAEIWTGAARRSLIESFGTSELPDICAGCTYYADGEALLNNPAMSHFNIGDNPWVVISDHAPNPATLLGDALRELHADGYRRIALYGAGAFTRKAVAGGSLDLTDLGVVAVIDDNPTLHDTRLCGTRIINRHDALTDDIDVVVLSSDRSSEVLWKTSADLRTAGIPVRSLFPVTAR